MDGSFIPSLLVNSADKVMGPTADLSKQDDPNYTMGPGFKSAGRDNGLFLSKDMEVRVMITIVPGAPNNKSQFHVERVTASEINELFTKEYKIQGGAGPTLEVFIPPTEATARFQWDRPDKTARETMSLLLALDEDDPNKAGLPEDDPKTKGKDESKLHGNGFLFVNQQRDIYNHARAVAAEVLSAFADNVQGRIATVMPREGMKLKGNMAGSTLQISGAPSAKVNVVHDFPGQAKQISRFSLMDDNARYWVLGIIPHPDER